MYISLIQKIIESKTTNYSQLISAFLDKETDLELLGNMMLKFKKKIKPEAFANILIWIALNKNENEMRKFLNVFKSSKHNVKTIFQSLRRYYIPEYIVEKFKIKEIAENVFTPFKNKWKDKPVIGIFLEEDILEHCSIPYIGVYEFSTDIDSFVHSSDCLTSPLYYSIDKNIEELETLNNKKFDIVFVDKERDIKSRRDNTAVYCMKLDEDKYFSIKEIGEGKYLLNVIDSDKIIKEIKFEARAIKSVAKLENIVSYLEKTYGGKS